MRFQKVKEFLLDNSSKEINAGEQPTTKNKLKHNFIETLELELCRSELEYYKNFFDETINAEPRNKDLKHIFNDGYFANIYQQFLVCFQAEYDDFLKASGLGNKEFHLVEQFKRRLKDKLEKEFTDSYEKDIHGFKKSDKYEPIKNDYSWSYLKKEGNNLVLNLGRIKSELVSYFTGLRIFIKELEEIFVIRYESKYLNKSKTKGTTPEGIDNRKSLSDNNKSESLIDKAKEEQQNTNKKEQKDELLIQIEKDIEQVNFYISQAYQKGQKSIKTKICKWIAQLWDEKYSQIAGINNRLYDNKKSFGIIVYNLILHKEKDWNSDKFYNIFNKF